MEKRHRINIGHEIKKRVKEKKVTVVWLANNLGCHRTNIYRIFESQSIDTAVLERISILLEFDFFSLYSNSLKQHLSSSL